MGWERLLIGGICYKGAKKNPSAAFSLGELAERGRVICRLGGGSDSVKMEVMFRSLMCEV